MAISNSGSVGRGKMFETFVCRNTCKKEQGQDVLMVMLNKEPIRFMANRNKSPQLSPVKVRRSASE